MSARAHFASLRLPVLGIVAVLVLSVLGQLPASAIAPTPTGLSPAGGVAVSATPTLQWDRVPTATSYRVQVATSAAFTSILWEDTTVNRRAVPTRALPSGDIYWRVRAVDSTGTGDWATTSFNRSGIAGPTLVSPADEASLAQPTQAALLSWTPVNGAASYTIEIDTEDQFIGATSYTTKTSSYVVPNPQIKTTYFWRVRASMGSSVVSQWSNPRTYEILGLSKPKLTGPQNDENFKVEDVVLDWQPVAGARSYQLQVSLDSNFLTFALGLNGKSVEGTKYSPPETLGNDQYFWRVRPVDAQGNTPDWTQMDTWAFQRHWPDQPTLQHPANNTTVADPFFYQWSPVEHASHYQLQVSQSSDFNSYSTCSTVHTTYTPRNSSECWPQAEKQYYWRVLAIDAPQTNPNPVTTDIIAAQVGRFLYSPGLVQSVFPADGATVQVPTLRWEAVSGAEKYRVRVYKVSTGSEVVDKTTYALSYTPTSQLAVDTEYRWQVQSISPSGRTSVEYLAGSQDTFTVVAADAASASYPNPVTPSAGSQSTRMPAMTWAPVAGATSYKVYFRQAGASAYDLPPVTTAYPALTDASLKWADEGDYEWIVEAYTGSVALATSTFYGEFSIRKQAAVTGQRVAITGIAAQSNATSCDTSLSDPSPSRCVDLRQTPVLRWDPEPDAGSYMIWISRDREMTNEYNDELFGLRVESNQWIWDETLIDSQAGSAYFWIVQACKPNCPPKAYATHAFNKKSNPVEPTAPAEGAIVQNDVTFAWRDYMATNLTEDSAYRDETRVNPQLEARTYVFQIATDPNFQNVIDTAEVDQTTYTPYDETYPEGPLYWRVRANDGSDNPMSWSRLEIDPDTLEDVPFSIVKSSPIPTLQSPVSGQTVGSTEPFRWNPLAFAGSYDIEVYKNGDTIGSSANRVLSGSSKQVAYTTTTPLPASPNPYVWRIRREDADGRKGAWTALTDPGASFRIVGSAPVQANPNPGDSLVANESLFTWAAVDGAASYRFERRIASTVTTSESQTTTSLAWAPTSKLASGNHEWRVSSLDTDGAVLASSPWRAFSVTAPATTSTPPPPTTTTPPPTTTTPPPTTSTPKPDKTAPAVSKVSPSKGSKVKKSVNFKSVFNEKVKNVTAKTFTLKQKGKGGKIAAKVTLSSDGKTAKLNPKKNLKKGKTYIATLSSKITDIKGNALPVRKWKVKVK